MSEENIKYFAGTITEEERTFRKDFGKAGGFSVLMPRPSQKIGIISATASALGNKPMESIEPKAYDYTRMVVTLNSVIVDKPSWWEGAENCVDEELLESLWRFYLSCEMEFASRLKTKAKGKVVEQT